MVSSENPYRFPSLPTSPPPAPATLLPILGQSQDGRLRPFLRSESDYHAHCFVHDAWAVARRLVLSKISLCALESHIAISNPNDRSLEDYNMNDRLRDFFTGNQPQLVVSNITNKFAEIRPQIPGRILINHNTVQIGKTDYRHEEHYHSSYPRHVLFSAVLIAHEMVKWGCTLLGYTAAVIIESPADLARAWESDVFGGRLTGVEIGLINMHSCRGSTYNGDIECLIIESQAPIFVNHYRGVPDSVVTRIVTAATDWELHLPIRGAWHRKKGYSDNPDYGLWLVRELGPGIGRGLVPPPLDPKEELRRLYMRPIHIPAAYTD